MVCFVYISTSFHEPATDGLRFIYSRDGWQWQQVDGIWLKPEVGKQRVMRDPSIIRTPDGMFHLVWTSSWRGDRGFGYACSKDLVHWSEQRFIEVMTDTTTVNVWAPELFWDDVRQQAVIIWASCIPGKFPDGQEEHKNNHRLYYTTTKDFKRFAPAKLMIEPGFSCIDATLVKRGNKDYVMVLKDNTRPERDIKVAYATSPYGPWSKASEPFTDKMMEGPTTVKVTRKIDKTDESGWLIYYDRYELKDFGAHFTKDFQTFEDVSNKVSVPHLHKHGTIFEADEAILQGLLNAKKIHYTGTTLSNPNRHDGGLSPVVGVHNIQILRANREHPSEANGQGWTYNHQPMMAYWNDQFYIHYLCDPSDEHIPPSHTMLQTSRDGYQWSTPQILFPEVQVPEGFQKPGREEKAHNLIAIMHQRVGWYVSKSGQLFAIGNYGVAFDRKDDPNDGNGIGRVIREVKRDGSFGPIYFIYHNGNYGKHVKDGSYKPVFPYYTKADKATKKACEEILANPRYRMQWVEEADRNDPLIPLHKEYKAYCDYTLPDGQIASLWKHALTSTSADGGLTWAQPVERAKGFVNSNAKIWGQRLTDGTYATIYNPSEYRWPLGISLSTDGYEYTTLNLVQGEVPPMRYGGNYKSYGPQYVRGIQEGNGIPRDSDLWVTYSMNKEDMWVAHIPVPVQTEAHTHATAHEFHLAAVPAAASAASAAVPAASPAGSSSPVPAAAPVPAGSSAGPSAPSLAALSSWNIYSPVYAPVSLSDGWLTLSDSDPFDYARVERKIPATQELKVNFDIQARQNDHGLLQIEFLDSHGTACSRIELTDEGIMRCKGGARYGTLGKYEPNTTYHIEAILSVAKRMAEVYINGKKAGQRMFFAPVEAIERIMFRTGSERRFPDIDTPADWYGTLDHAGDRAPEAVFSIANVVTTPVPTGSSAGSSATTPAASASGGAFLRYDTYRPYVDYFNTMEPETIAQAIPNDRAWQWMKDNVPLFDCPDRGFEEMWYFRWWTLRKHIEQTPVGYAMTEFLVNRSYADQYNLIASGVGHHIHESRWLRDTTYLDQIMNTWYHGNDGQPMKKLPNYSSWIAHSLWGRYLVDGRKQWIVSMLPSLEWEYNLWESTHTREGGLYWQADVQDAMEETISGGRRKKYLRPSINSYMYGNAMAVGHIALLAGDDAKAQVYFDKAADLREKAHAKLWNDRHAFFETHRIDSSANVREAIGFLPWYTHMAKDEARYAAAWRQAADPQGFSAPYGLTTAERRHPLFRTHGVGKCEWDGAVWPFATSQTLTALANFANDYTARPSATPVPSSAATAPVPAASPAGLSAPVPAGSSAGPSAPMPAASPAGLPLDSLFFSEMEKYMQSQHMRGKPYIGEYLDETTGYWLKGDQERSRYYNHSTWNDLVITGLCGLRPRADRTIEVNPLLPADKWPYFCLDNVPYHGHFLTIVWDRDGSRYHAGRGLRVYVDGKLMGHRPTIGKLLLADAL